MRRILDAMHRSIHRVYSRPACGDAIVSLNGASFNRDFAGGGMLKASLVTVLVVVRAIAQTPATLPMQPQIQPANDPFIGSIQAMKHSVAPVACLEVSQEKTKIIEIQGSAFFISARGEFITAAHVIDAMSGAARLCPVTAVFLPAIRWQPEVREEDFIWFPFKIKDCTINREIDAAKCTPLGDLSVRQPGLKFTIDPVVLESSRPPDGTQVAFTGFPLRSRDPMTSRAGIANYRTVARGTAVASELILDRGAWNGGSGSPVYLWDGRVIGMIVASGSEQGTGFAVARPVESLREMLAGR